MHVAILPDSDDRFFRRLLYPMFMVAVMPRTTGSSRRAVLDVVDLVDEPLLRLGPGFASHAWFDAACRIERIRPRVVLESITPHSLIALARTGFGIARSIPLCGFRARRFVQPWSCTVGRRSGNGRSSPGTDNVSCRPTRSSS